MKRVSFCLFSDNWNKGVTLRKTPPPFWCSSETTWSEHKHSACQEACKPQCFLSSNLHLKIVNAKPFLSLVVCLFCSRPNKNKTKHYSNNKDKKQDFSKQKLFRNEKEKKKQSWRFNINHTEPPYSLSKVWNTGMKRESRTVPSFLLFYSCTNTRSTFPFWFDL